MQDERQSKRRMPAVGPIGVRAFKVSLPPAILGGSLAKIPAYIVLSSREGHRKQAALWTQRLVSPIAGPHRTRFNKSFATSGLQVYTQRVLTSDCVTIFYCTFRVKNYRINSGTNFYCGFLPCFIQNRSLQKTPPCAKFTELIPVGFLCGNLAVIKFPN